MDKFDPTAPKPFLITVSARALFDMEADHAIFTEQGEEAFEAYQFAHEKEVLKPGTAFALVKKLLDLNARLPEGARRFEVMLLSRNSPETGTRVFNSMEHYTLPIYRAIFTRGESPSRYIKAIGVDLFLSSNPDQVRQVVAMGVAGAALVPHAFDAPAADEKIRIAFDGDAVLFSDQAELAYIAGGLPGFQEHERRLAATPLPAGPMKPFLEAINVIQKAFPGNDCPVRTALVTARSVPAHHRALNTLRCWGVRVDEGMFLGGKEKGPLLEAFGADLFLDDSRSNIDNAVAHNVRSGHVPFGSRNEPDADERNFTGGQGAVDLAPTTAVATAPAAPVGLETPAGGDTEPCAPRPLRPR